MDVLDAVREARPEAEVTDAEVASARHRLMAEVAASSSKRRDRVSAGRVRGLRWGAGLVGAAAAVAAGVVVATNLLPVGPENPEVPPVLLPPSASAAEVLAHAATQVEGTAPVPGPGQYLLIEETVDFLNVSATDAATDVLMPMGDRASAEAGFVTERIIRLYVPADREDEWVWDLRDPWSVTQTFGERADEAVAQWRKLDAGGGDTPDVWRLPGGRAPESPEAPEATLDGREFYVEMPRDPRQLLDWFRARTDATGAEADRMVVWTVSSTLSSSLAPAELRAVMFDALALIEGVQIVDQSGETVTFSFTAHDGDWQRTTRFTLDTATSLITELSDLATGTGGSVVPDTVPDEVRRVSVKVVDAAP